jgi:hypothetical protein
MILAGLLELLHTLLYNVYDIGGVIDHSIPGNIIEHMGGNIGSKGYTRFPYCYNIL